MNKWTFPIKEFNIDNVYRVKAQHTKFIDGYFKVIALVKNEVHIEYLKGYPIGMEINKRTRYITNTSYYANKAIDLGKVKLWKILYS